MTAQQWEMTTQALALWIRPLAAGAVVVLVGWLARAVFDRLVLPGIVRAGRRNVEQVARGAHSLVLPASIVLGLQVALSRAPIEADARAWGTRALSALLIVLATLVIGRVLAQVLGSYVSQIEGLRPLEGVSERIALLLIWAVGLLMALSQLNIEIAPLLTTLGVAGLATALALQDTLANFFAGLYLLADRPVRVGDYVKLDGGAEGYVVGVGWRSTKIRQLQNNIVVIPNQKVAQSIITNYHLPEPRLALLIAISVDYSADPDHVERVLLEEVAQATGEVEGLLAEPPPQVRLIPGFGDSALQLTLICHVREFVDQFVVQHELRKRILRRFRAEGLEIPVPQRRVHLDRTIIEGLRAPRQARDAERDGPESAGPT